VGAHTFEEQCREWVYAAAEAGWLTFLPQQIEAHWSANEQIDLREKPISTARCAVKYTVTNMSWSELQKRLQNENPSRLIKIIKGLYDLAPQNKAYLRTKLLETPGDPVFLETCRKEIIDAIYPPHREFPKYPKFAAARKAVNNYKKIARDVRGTIDLLLTYVETGTQFTLDYGDIDENFYVRLETALENAAESLKSDPDGATLYERFRPRFLELNEIAGRIGWGYGDTITEIVDELENLFEP